MLQYSVIVYIDLYANVRIFNYLILMKGNHESKKN